ncbi:MAG: nitroreductase family protein [Denitrovibrio sp.]|nr:MAG: nitroreductase family protein [Denitrovibrio sp.]
MELKQAIEQRRSINFFDTEKKIDTDTINKILELASLAPSSMNLQPWKVLTVVSDEKKELLKSAAFNQPKVTEASAVFVLLGDLDYMEKNIDATLGSMVELGYMDKDAAEVMAGKALGAHGAPDSEKRYKNAILNTSIFGMNLMYACLAYGVETHPMGGFDPKELKAKFGLSNRLIPVMLIAAGYLSPEKTLKPRVKRLLPKDFNHIL